MGEQRARAVLKNRAIRPLKRFGQSFLDDRETVRRIVALADLHADDLVVEIGAGLGVMTELLARDAGRVKALEIDPYLIDLLRDKFADRPNVEVIHADVLKYDFEAALEDEGRARFKIVGNIPYNISSQILFRLLAFRRVIESMVIMFQKEMAERITAEPGTKAYGIPTVIVRMHAEVKRQMIIPGRSFYPPPRVDSAVLTFRFRKQPLCEMIDENVFTGVVKAAFSQRRKTLFNNLRSAGPLIRSAAETQQALDRAGIDGRRRAETLSVEEFAGLGNAVAALRAPQPGDEVA